MITTDTALDDPPRPDAPAGLPAYGRGMRSQEVQLVAVPEGSVTAHNFGVFDVDTGEPGVGQVLIGLRRLGLNAGLVHRLGGEGTSYGPGVAVGDVPDSDAVVEVLESNDPRWNVGDLAITQLPWRSAAVIDADDARPIEPTASEEELDARMTVLGHVGFTAWTGMVHVGQVQPEDAVYVSGAAGGVGSCAVQFARALGARVVGVAGSVEKVAMLTEVLGVDRAVNRRDGSAVDLLREAAPDGIDLYYDNVGGEQLEAALEMLSVGGRVVMCGAMAGARAPRNLRRVIHQELTVRGFTVTAHENLRDQFEAQVGEWFREGKVRSIHTVFNGIDDVPTAFESLLTGSSTGRVIVKVPSQR